MPAPDRHPLPGHDVLVSAPRSKPLRMHVADHGRSTGRLPLLMIAEPPATSYLWRDVARDLELDHRCVMPDLVGCGTSERPENRKGFSVHAQAEALRGLLDLLALRRVAVVAGGVAGLIAIELAALDPGRVAALVLTGTVLHADSWPVAGVLPFLPPGAGEVAMARLRRPHNQERSRRRLAALLSTQDGPDLEHYLEPLLRPGGGRSLLRVLRSVDMDLARGSLELVVAAPPPTLVLWGSQDRQLSPEYGQRVAGELAASWVPIADAGHLVARDRPERVAEEISAFLAGVE